MTLVSGVTTAQPAFPAKPVRLIVGSPAGGGNDIVARILAVKLSEHLGQQVIVDNRGGANGIIGMELAARAAPDGHTLYMGTAGHLSVNAVYYPKLPFNMERDFVPLTQVVSLPFLLYLLRRCRPNHWASLSRTPRPIPASWHGLRRVMAVCRSSPVRC